MRALSASLTAASAVIALLASGFVPAPAPASLFAAAAEARPPSQGSSKGSRGQQKRGGAKAKAPAGKQAAKARKKGTRKASGKSSRPKTTTLAEKAPAAAPTRAVSVAGDRLEGNFATKAAIAVTGSKLGVSAETARPGPPPLPPRAKGKGAASPAKQAAKSRKNGERRAGGKTSRTRTARVEGKQAGPSRKRTRRGRNRTAQVAAKPAVAGSTFLAAAASTAPPPVPARTAQSPRRTQKAPAPPAKQRASIASKESRNSSNASSTITRQQPFGGGAPITAAPAPKAKQGKKSRFYFRPFSGWFGWGKKK